ncbi:sulfatase-like hydrolase/transferase [Tautonia marina]|uniref:sulfatase-like hydrolase/transferase n=1 Tax=Tautonia marina TaxID=2653855 RepID=UPI001375C0B5|nr:sulfatase-like hydrolase/transferase [Tautonia marina]
MIGLEKTMLSFFVACVFSLPSDASAFAEDATPIRVACLGDSITAGARVDPTRESYPARLQELLGGGFEVRNFGIGGATLIRTGRPNIWRDLDAVKEFQPNIAVISLGTNDTVGGSRRNWEQIDRFEEDYTSLIAALADLPTRPRIVVCTPTAMVLTTPGLSEDRLADLTQRKTRLQELCRRIRALTRRHEDQNVSLLELNEVLQDRPQLLSAGDGVHPNASGYLAIAQTVAEHLRPQPKRPNIVLFLVDDMGWQDTSVPFHEQATEFNRRYRTPHMEQLARTGMKFTQAYACSVCSPTRISLMTGLNAARHRVTNWTLRKNASNDRAHPQLDFPMWNVNGLSPEPGIERTIHAKALPAYLSEAGYRTIHVGKAHFGAIGTPGSDPRNLGFDVNIAGHAAGGPGSFLGQQNFSAVWREGDRVWDVPGLECYHGKDIFLTEALTKEANKAVDRAVAADKPFFLYLSHYAVHVPFAVDSRFYQKYRDEGLDHTESMYAAMVEGMDKSLGDVLANVERHGLSNETIVLFMSDNGGLSAHGRGGTPHTHNTPLSSGKGSAHEGGIRVPMIVSWPGVTEAGSVCRQPVIIEDFFPTFLEMAGVPSVEQIGGVVDGRSFVGLLQGDQDQAREARPLVWHFPNHWGPEGPGIGPSSTIRLGDWKLIYDHQSQQYELFNLAEDLGEQNNLVAQHPEVRDRLAGELAEYLISVEAQMPINKATAEKVPYPGPAAVAGEDR